MRTPLGKVPFDSLCRLECGCIVRAKAGGNGHVTGWRTLVNVSRCRQDVPWSCPYCEMTSGSGAASSVAKPPQMLVEPLDELSVALYERFD